MKKEFKLRYTIIGILFTVILALLVVQLFSLQFVKGEAYLAKEQSFSRKVLRLTGPRGKILDSNGLPLAYNKTSYSVEFIRDPKLNSVTDRVKYTQAILQTYRTIIKNGGKFLSTFAIRKQQDGSLDFTFPGMDKTDDPKAYDARVKQWLDNNCIKGKIIKTDPPDKLFQECREYYEVPADATYDEAFAILSVWQEVRATRFESYLPVTLADDVNYETVAEVQMARNDLPGMLVDQSSTRVYPNKSMAAHIIGYMGRMLDEPQMKAYEAMGYTSDDLVGISGIELSEEPELTGNTTERTGTSVVEVDNWGRPIRNISAEDKTPTPGNNVMLTIDSNLQKRLESALQDNIQQIKDAQVAHYNQNKDYYDGQLKMTNQNEINWASVGAGVVMDVQTGNILAMASSPTFDPNMFTGGLSSEDFKKLMDESANKPLFNNAISSRGTPGSIFKMTTGLAGLMEGQITLDTKISDGGEFRDHLSANDPETGPKCWVYPRIGEHKDQDIIKALTNSCNYFFYTVAFKVKVDGLNKWADMLGLTSTTGVELPGEIAGQVGNQQTLYSPGNMSGVAALVRNNIVKMIRDECVSLGMNYDDGKYTAVALEMMNLVNQSSSNWGPDIRSILKNELKMASADIVKSNIFNQISIELTQIQWNAGYTIEDGIGQSVTMLTPIGVARYVSAIVNGGNVYEARLVKEIIEPNGKTRENPPKLLRNLKVDPAYLDAIKAGMHGVISSEEGGTASTYFQGWQYQNDIGGKTGTAQVNKAIDLENNSWFVAFAPYDKPEIAVVIYIPHGYKGALSSYAAKQVLQYYMDKKNNVNTVDNMPAVDELAK